MGDPLGLVGLVVGVVAHDRLARPGLGPQLLGLAPEVVGDHRVGRVEDGLARPVVLLEQHHGDVRERVLELEDVAHVRPAELVDRLVAVADDADVAALGREHEDEIVLDAVGVLVLVDEDVAEPTLVVLEHLGELAEQLDGVDQQVVEVHGPGLEQAGLVVGEDVRDLALEDRLGPFLVLLGADSVVLGGRDGAVHRARRELLGIETEVADDVSGEAVGVGLVVDRERRREPHLPGIAAQDAYARRVERGHPHLLGDRTDQLGHPALHLVGGLVGEGDGQDLERRDTLVLDEVGDAVGEHAGLARARAGHDEKGPARCG